MTEQAFWTIAYRKPKANRFIRKNLFLTWQEAFDRAGAFKAAHPDLEVFYVTNLSAEQCGYCAEEDRGNIMTDSSKRIRIYEEIPGSEVT